MMLKFKFLLRMLATLLQRAIRTDQDAARHVAGRDVTFQIRTVSGAGRHYRIDDGKVTSRAGIAPAADFTMTFTDPGSGFAILSASDAQGAFLQGLHDGQLALSGDFAKLLWFQRLTEFLQPKAGGGAAAGAASQPSKAFRTLATVTAFLFAALFVVWMFLPATALASWGVVFTPSAGLVSRRAAAMYGGIAVMFLLARNAPASAGRSALVSGLVAACLLIAGLGVYEFAAGRAQAGIMGAVVIEVALAGAFILNAHREARG